MNTICILTASRAEYGLLKPLIRELKKNSIFEVRIVVTGTHLCPEYGYTYKEIEEDGHTIDKKLDMLLSNDTATGITKSMGVALIGFADYFAETKPDLLVVLGDRYETLAVCTAAMIQRIPIAHIHGGETTEGAIDEAVRHAITKISYLHFTSTDLYRRRVIQLGEEPQRVFTVGGLGTENAMKELLLGKNEVEQLVGLKLNKPYALVTFHPETLGEQKPYRQMQELLSALNKFNEIIYIFTKTNADEGGKEINRMIDSFVEEHTNAVAFCTLGMKGYLSAMKFCSLVIGNSSSGILEAPVFCVPVINIGDRQKGRIQAGNTLNCYPEEKAIIKQIQYALSDDFRKTLDDLRNPYGNGNTANLISSIIEDFFVHDKINLKKCFYDIDIANPEESETIL